MIKNVKKYKLGTVDAYRVLYESGKIRYFAGECPKTVSKFMATTDKRTEQDDWFNGTEIIYEKEA